MTAASIAPTEPFGRPAEAQPAAGDEPEHAGEGERQGYETVLLAVPALCGLPRGKEFDAGFFTGHVLGQGAHASGYLLTADAHMRMLPGFALGGWEHGAGDILLRPDISTLRRAGWLGDTAIVFADAHDRDGAPLPFAPGAVLTRQLTRLTALGLSASLGIEAEASVYEISFADAARRGYRDLPPAAEHNTDYALARPSRLNALIALIRRTALDSGLPLEAVKTEAGPGQLEVTFRHGEPMATAYRHLVYKLLAHAAAEQLGMALTFMAKPFTGRDGNSGHLHLSLTDAHGAGVLLDAQGVLTATGRHALAGCLAVLGPLAPLMLPQVNSYKRLHVDGPPLFAPNTLTWGYDNRTCALRVLGAGDSGRIECRIPGADAQPHLAAAAMIAAIAYGIEHQLQLTEQPVTASAYQRRDAAALPRTLEQAAAVFAASPLAAELLGGDVLAHYATAFGHEAEYHRARVSDLERLRGFALT